MSRFTRHLGSGRIGAGLLTMTLLTLPLAVAPACSGALPTTTLGTSGSAGTGGGATGTGGSGGMAQGTGGAVATTGSTGTGGAGGTDPGPNVDTSDPQLYTLNFKPDDADPAAKTRLGVQPAYLDTRVTPRGLLVVYLHGAGAPGTCGSTAHEQVLAGLGFHVLGPCYTSDYGIGNCGADIEGCRLEAFDGQDHHPFITITPPESIETRVAKGLAYLQTKNPKGDWAYYLDGDKPRWSKIIISGISHGASTSGVIGLHRLTNRVVMLSGPLDTDQAWLKKTPMTPVGLFYGFSHTADPQHPGHLAAFESLGLPGKSTTVDGAMPPFGGTHRLETSAATSDGHSSVQAGGTSPKMGTSYVFAPVWDYLYTSAP
ncbi:MAG: hypothetical protein ABJE95_19985 [Byssovorax sp.]